VFGVLEKWSNGRGQKAWRIGVMERRVNEKE
jgi:hypothetical protein